VTVPGVTIVATGVSKTDGAIAVDVTIVIIFPAMTSPGGGVLSRLLLGDWSFSHSVCCCCVGVTADRRGLAGSTAARRASSMTILLAAARGCCATRASARARLDEPTGVGVDAGLDIWNGLREDESDREQGGGLKRGAISILCTGRDGRSSGLADRMGTTKMCDAQWKPTGWARRRGGEVVRERLVAVNAACLK
jgi:hypothetical protein